MGLESREDKKKGDTTSRETVLKRVEVTGAEGLGAVSVLEGQILCPRMSEGMQKVKGVRGENPKGREKAGGWALKQPHEATGCHRD